MKKAYPLVLMVFALLLLLGCVLEDESSKAVEEELAGIGIEATAVEANSDSVTVYYSQESDFSEEEMYATWAAVLAVAQKHYPSVQSLSAVSVFDDGEKISATTNSENLTAFLSDSINGAEFLYGVDIVYAEKDSPNQGSLQPPAGIIDTAINLVILAIVVVVVLMAILALRGKKKEIMPAKVSEGKTEEKPKEEKAMTKKEYSDAMKLLRERFARGEITKEEFREMKKELEE